MPSLTRKQIKELLPSLAQFALRVEGVWFPQGWLYCGFIGGSQGKYDFHKFGHHQGFQSDMLREIGETHHCNAAVLVALREDGQVLPADLLEIGVMKGRSKYQLVQSGESYGPREVDLLDAIVVDKDGNFSSVLAQCSKWCDQCDRWIIEDTAVQYPADLDADQVHHGHGEECPVLIEAQRVEDAAAAAKVKP